MVRPPLPDTPPSDVEMQIIDLRVVDAAYLESCSRESTFPPSFPLEDEHEDAVSTDPNPEPRVLLFGTSSEGWSTSIIVDGFRPYFDIEFPDTMTGSRDGTTITLTKPWSSRRLPPVWTAETQTTLLGSLEGRIGCGGSNAIRRAGRESIDGSVCAAAREASGTSV